MWTYNGIRIFLQEQAGNGEQIIARLQPLSGTTVKQFFGYTEPIHKLNAIIVGDTDLSALKTCRTTGLAYDLVLDGDTIGSYSLKSISWNRIRTISQTMRNDLDCTAPVYSVELELYE